jgi:glucose-1-phosphate cytidylyltransferase
MQPNRSFGLSWSEEAMKVVILCGGLGTRLRQHTEHVPKPMVPIGDRPILWHIMKSYSYYGYNDFVLCLGYKGDRIKEYFYNFHVMNNNFTVMPGQKDTLQLHGNCDELSWRVTLVDTGLEAMTGARVKRVADFLDGDRFMLTYGDGVSDVNIREVVDFHDRHGQLATVTGVHPPARFGELMLQGRQVARFSEKPQVMDTWVNGGFFVFEPEVLDYIDDDEACVLERAPLERLATGGQLQAYLHHGFWQCMDTHRDWKILNETWQKGRAPWATWQQPENLVTV